MKKAGTYLPAFYFLIRVFCTQLITTISLPLRRTLVLYNNIQQIPPRLITTLLPSACIKEYKRLLHFVAYT
ncbi:MAG: hypothetical protein JWQ96_1549 [Segetibacter sp.]|nr:hypothetical protein [Segetibacter sp.]